MKALKEEIAAVLRDKLDTAVKAYQVQREQDLEEVATLKGALETLEAQKADIQKKMGSLNTKKAVDLAEYNRLTQKLTWLGRQTKGKQSQADTLMSKLTELDVDPKTLNLLLNFKGLKNA